MVLSIILILLGNEKYNNSRFVVINLSAISFSKNTSKISTSNGFTIFVNKY